MDAILDAYNTSTATTNATAAVVPLVCRVPLAPILGKCMNTNSATPGAWAKQGEIVWVSCFLSLFFFVVFSNRIIYFLLEHKFKLSPNPALNLWFVSLVIVALACVLLFITRVHNFIYDSRAGIIFYTVGVGVHKMAVICAACFTVIHFVDFFLLKEELDRRQGYNMVAKIIVAVVATVSLFQIIWNGAVTITYKGKNMEIVDAGRHILTAVYALIGLMSLLMYAVSTVVHGKAVAMQNMEMLRKSQLCVNWCSNIVFACGMGIFFINWFHFKDSYIDPYLFERSAILKALMPGQNDILKWLEMTEKTLFVDFYILHQVAQFYASSSMEKYPFQAIVWLITGSNEIKIMKKLFDSTSQKPTTHETKSGKETTTKEEFSTAPNDDESENVENNRGIKRNDSKV